MMEKGRSMWEAKCFFPSPSFYYIHCTEPWHLCVSHTFHSRRPLTQEKGKRKVVGLSISQQVIDWLIFTSNLFNKQYYHFNHQRLCYATCHLCHKTWNSLFFLRPFPCGFLFLVNFTKNWSCDQILVIFTKNWSCDQFQLSLWPNFGNFYQTLITLPISIVIATKFGQFLPKIGHVTNFICHHDQGPIFLVDQKLGLDPIFGKNPNFWDLQPLRQGIGERGCP